MGTDAEIDGVSDFVGRLLLVTTASVGILDDDIILSEAADKRSESVGTNDAVGISPGFKVGVSENVGVEVGAVARDRVGVEATGSLFFEGALTCFSELRTGLIFEVGSDWAYEKIG